MDDDLARFWEALLSADAPRIRAAWEQVQAADRPAVLDHLRRMAGEPGWQPVQQQAAEAALRVILEQAG